MTLPQKSGVQQIVACSTPPMQVTISLLPSSLSLVHIPRSRLPHLSHPILKQILRPNPTFLNITCNEVELSLFAEQAVLEDFEPIARRNRRKQRAKSKSASAKAAGSSSLPPDMVEVSYERWSVLQVDSHNDQIDNSGARVNEVSALLAAAGISILYHSTYMSDFILVKESRLQETMNLLADAGFDIYTSSMDSLPINARAKERYSIHDFRPTDTTATAPPMKRARSGTDPFSVNLGSTSVWSDYQRSSDATTPSTDITTSPLKKLSSPTAGQVHLLPSDLACVGLSEELGTDHWGLKIVKLVAFPDLIPSRAPPPCVSRVPVTPSVVPPPLPSRKPSTPLFDFSPPIIDPPVRTISPALSNSTWSSSEDDGYFSHSPYSKSSLSVVSSISRSQTDLREPSAISSPFKHRSRHLIQPLSTLSPTTYPLNLDPASQVTQGSRVPFFSYTRTAEGSSLTADVYVLAALFPPPERHMIICSGELDAADSRHVGLQPIDDMSDDKDAEDTDSSYPQGNILQCLQIDLQRFGLDKYGLVNRFSKVLEENKINHMYSSTFKTANLLVRQFNAVIHKAIPTAASQVEKKYARRAQALLCNC
ncbi:hypothetical protein D9615_000614 [Tricholomella constricta]|uniref:CASTOR ACT domain-containing protein n=1 Tax=Tricholomella constricta TaxID=117010 RepID=A0A8H5MBF3_9AGAR|nr:hypothetical protein D9615_000614 [Tricholomella constricta]